jgi:membrane fusion protein (multidrug efflux system)
MDAQISSPSPAPPVANRSRRRLVIFGLVALLIAGGVVGYRALTAGQEDTDDAQVTADTVPLGTRVSGQIVKVHIIENQVVKQGQLIAEVDPADYQARVKQAEAELATAQAQSQSADAQVRVVEATAQGGFLSAKAAVSGFSVSVGSAAAQEESAQAALLRSQTEARKAEIDLRRTKELLAANAVPQERLDAAQIAYDAAQAALAQARAQVAVARESKSVAKTRVREAQGRLNQSAPIDAQISGARAQADLAHARVRSAEAQLDLARLQLSYTKITAPAEGIAARLSVHEGQLVTMGQQVIALVPVQTYVVANFKETQIGQMRPGQRAEIEIDAFPGRKLEGKVESLSGGTGASFSLLPADNASGNFVKVVQRVPVRIAWNSVPADMVLRAGMSADVKVFTQSGSAPESSRK